MIFPRVFSLTSGNYGFGFGKKKIRCVLGIAPFIGTTYIEKKHCHLKQNAGETDLAHHVSVQSDLVNLDASVPGKISGLMSFP